MRLRPPSSRILIKKVKRDKTKTKNKRLKHQPKLARSWNKEKLNSIRITGNISKVKNTKEKVKKSTKELRPSQFKTTQFKELIMSTFIIVESILSSMIGTLSTKPYNHMQRKFNRQRMLI